MNYDKKNIYTVLIIMLILFILWQCMNVMKNGMNITLVEKEGMDPTITAPNEIMKTARPVKMIEFEDKNTKYFTNVKPETDTTHKLNDIYKTNHVLMKQYPNNSLYNAHTHTPHSCKLTQHRGSPDNFYLRKNRYMSPNNEPCHQIVIPTKRLLAKRLLPKRSLHKYEQNANCGISCMLHNNSMQHVGYKSQHNVRYNEPPNANQFKESHKCDSGYGCWKNTQWSVPYKSGANGVVSDALWHYTSPRMILKDNSMKCCEHTNRTNYVTPSGMPSDFTKLYDTNIKNVHKMTYDELLLPKGPWTMSKPMSNGIVPRYIQNNVHTDCVNSKVAKTYECNDVPNFHKPSF